MSLAILLITCVCPVWGQGVPVTLQWFETSWETMEDRTADAFMAGYHRVWTPPPFESGGDTASVGYDVFDRFSFGTPDDPTRYGTGAGLEAVAAEQDKAGIATFIDLIVNHNGFLTKDTPNFVTQGDYPGFIVTGGGDPQFDGDFHTEFEDCGSNPIICRIAGLIDIAQESNNVFIRHPVDPSNPQNIPAGTLYDIPDPANRQFYADTGLPANSIGIHPFNVADPMAGDPVTENATGLLLRNIRWLLEVVGIDGFRIDAGKHVPDWFFRDFYDRHVWNRGGSDLEGNPTTPFSFNEVFEGSFDVLDDYVCKGTNGNCNPADGVTGNRDVLDFPLFFALTSELNGTGLGSWLNIVNASFDRYQDNNANDGDFGVQFVQSHDSFGPAMDNLAYAYLLTRTGSPVVYFRAEEFGTPEFPKAGRGDALGGQFGNLLLTLLDIHNEYARGSYIERWIDADVLIFERDNACLVGLNDRADGGYDERTVSTNFAPGLVLHELTGNASDATVDPNNDLFDTVTVGAGGQITLRVPRVKNANDVKHDRNYVVYGPVNPDGDLTISPVASTIPADPPTDPNATRRLTPIDVIQSDTFEVKLETTDPDSTDPAEDDLALLRIDAGMDLNGNGGVDNTDPAFVGYGYETFLTESVSLESGGVDVGGGVFKGRYRQAIDATQLSEGRHYLSVIAFRSRPANAPTIFETFRKVILVDRVPPEIELASPAESEAITLSSFKFVVRSPDRTADRIHMFLDPAPGADVVAMAEQNLGLATQEDRDTFKLTLNGLTAGNHRLVIVAYEPTRPDPSVTTLNGISVVINGFDGLGDVTGDGRVDNRDIFPLVEMVNQGGQFSPNADFDGDGDVDADDLAGMATVLGGGE